MESTRFNCYFANQPKTYSDEYKKNPRKSNRRGSIQQ